MNHVSFQWMMIVVFGFLEVYIGYLNFKCASKIKIKDRQWTMLRIMMIVFGILSALEFFGGFSMLLLLRYIVTVAACVIFFFSHDGIGEDGFVSGFHFHSYQEVEAYDIYEQTKWLTVIFVIQKKDHKRKAEEVTFELKNKKAVEQLLKEKIAKKYRRLKKG